MPPRSRSRRACTTCVVLDLGLPRKEGLDVLACDAPARRRRPVLILTARDAIADRVAGLDAGADDYVVKPFDARRARRAHPRPRAPPRRPCRAGARLRRHRARASDPRGAGARRGGGAFAARVRAARGAPRHVPAPCCRVPSSKTSSTAGRRRSKAMPSRSISTAASQARRRLHPQRSRRRLDDGPAIGGASVNGAVWRRPCA